MNRHGGHVGHVTWTVFPQPKETLYEILLQIAQGLLRYLKLSKYESPGSKVHNDPDLLFSQIFMYSFKQL